MITGNQTKEAKHFNKFYEANQTAKTEVIKQSLYSKLMTLAEFSKMSIPNNLFESLDSKLLKLILRIRDHPPIIQAYDYHDLIYEFDAYDSNLQLVTRALTVAYDEHDRLQTLLKEYQQPVLTAALREKMRHVKHEMVELTSFLTQITKNVK